MGLTRRMVWATEEVTGEEFVRRCNAWFAESHAHKLALRRDPKANELWATMTYETSAGIMQRAFHAPIVEVTNALRALSGEDCGLHEVVDGDGPEGDHHESCDCFACTQERLF